VGHDDEDAERARAIADEARRARILKMVVDLTTNVIVQGGLTRAEAEDIVDAARRRALDLFPGKEETWDLVLAPRFARLMDEFVGPRTGAAAPFRES